MSDIRSRPCIACPYRKDVPSGVWSASDYDKLPPYDQPTGQQPPAPFGCHATPEHLCSGWAQVHTSRGRENDLLALRLAAVMGLDVEVPPKSVELFESGTAAAEHGKRDIDNPDPEAVRTMQLLLRKYGRLRER